MGTFSWNFSGEAAESREASGDALNKSSKFCQNLSVKNRRELKNKSLFTKIAFSCGENAGLV